MINRTGIENDINLEQACRAFDGVSLRSDKRITVEEIKAMALETKPE